jgi:hypothetical protein
MASLRKIVLLNLDEKKEILAVSRKPPQI